MRTRRVDREKSRDIMLNLYRQLPLIFRAAYAALFQQIMAGELPLLFHCAVGKDRTGVAAALVLSALGVEREQIVEDYVLTEQFFERTCAAVLRGHLGELFAQSEQADWDPLVRADASYLHAMFDHLQLWYGGVDAYLEAELSLSPAARATMRNRLLEQTASREPKG
jgi:protein-tyrosine phosphatase